MHSCFSVVRHGAMDDGVGRKRQWGSEGEGREGEGGDNGEKRREK